MATVNLITGYYIPRQLVQGLNGCYPNATRIYLDVPTIGDNTDEGNLELDLIYLK